MTEAHTTAPPYADPAALAPFADLIAREYPDLPPGYLNTATLGIAPRRALDVVRAALADWGAGRPELSGYEQVTEEARESFARLTGVGPSEVALASTVAEAVGLVASALPAGAEVVAYEGDFSSLVHPFSARPGLRLRLVPLEGVADAVREGTALVAVSAAQSADGRVADLAAIREAAAAHGARTLIDATQSTGWLPTEAGAHDYLVCHGYKWLVSPHGAAFLTVRPGAESTLSAAFAGWYAAEDRWGATYGPIDRLAPGAQQFDARPAYLPYVAARASLSLVEELGVERVHAHDTALAERLREGFRSLGYPPVPGPSAIVAVPGVPDGMAERLTAAGVAFSSRAGNLRFAVHFYNTAADVDLVLNAAS